MESDCDSDDLLEGSWSLYKRKKEKSSVSDGASEKSQDVLQKLSERTEKFKQLKEKSAEIKLRASARSQKTEAIRTKKLLKKALKDPWIKAAVEGESSVSKNVEEDEQKKWEGIKPFLSINDHLQGPIPHGDCGPKTELEYKIEDCIKEGDFEKAELLSDTLVNREFAVKIANAFAAKNYQEKLDEQKSLEKNRATKKIRWMFDAKERWQMKGNM